MVFAVLIVTVLIVLGLLYLAGCALGWCIRKGWDAAGRS
jgi:hypothetical protein